ncbi:DUF2892 domain-containing protein [Pontibacter ruber]|uniref:DUF2892 domain-containing protein n=1 Tax=Pontibacter ruber TaxID=1343895 RepID=A0ABW5CZK7_9BACT|nr:DUF2892 domain-containing protein [Pontibacter ruber]
MKEERKGRVRKSTPLEANKEIDEKTIENIQRYGYRSREAIDKRLTELTKEWDIEKTLEVNASTLALTGLALGAFVNRRWFILPGVVASFLLQHGLQGWCPPLPLFRALKIRTRQEISEEVFALKAMRGDFKDLENKSPGELLQTVRS